MSGSFIPPLNFSSTDLLQTTVTPTNASPNSFNVNYGTKGVPGWMVALGVVALVLLLKGK